MVKAFTVIELMVTTVLSLMIVTTALGLFSSSWRQYLTQQTNSQLQQESLQAVDAITGTVRQAVSVVKNIPNGTGTGSLSTSIVLKLPALDTSGALIGNADDYIIFKPDSNDATKLIRTVIPASPASLRYSWPTPLTVDGDLGTLQFSYYNADGSVIPPGSDVTTTARVSVTVTSQKTVHGQTISRTLTDLVSLRN